MFIGSLPSGSLIILFLPGFLWFNLFLHLPLYSEIILVIGEGNKGPWWKGGEIGRGHGQLQENFLPYTVALGLPCSFSLLPVAVLGDGWGGCVTEAWVIGGHDPVRPSWP